MNQPAKTPYEIRTDVVPERYARGWHVIGLASDFSHEPVALNYFNTRLVAYRGRDDGEVHVLDSYCPHMGADLSKGCVSGNSLRCPFHDWSWGSDGVCDDIPYADKIVHFTFYFVAVILGSLYFLSLNNPWAKTLVKIIKLALLLVVFGMVIEVIQGTLTVNRSGDVFDAMANSTGVAVGFIIILSQFYGQRGLK